MMRHGYSLIVLAGWLLCGIALAADEPPDRFAGAEPLVWEGDLSARMVEGIHGFLDRKTAEAAERRSAHWQRDLASAGAYERSVEPNRRRLRGMIGLVDERIDPVEMERFGTGDEPALVGETDRYRIWQVRWPVLGGALVGPVFGEGLMLTPAGLDKPRAIVIAVPDADQTPEQLAGLAPSPAADPPAPQDPPPDTPPDPPDRFGGPAALPPTPPFAARLADAGCLVVIPALVSRRSTFSGYGEIVRTRQSHREWLYRQSYQMGRHVIGYEVHKALALADWAASRFGPDAPIGIAGYGEGGLIALYAAAVDARIDAALVSGYFGPRQELWREPIERNVFGLLRAFSDAEIASLIAPRPLIIEHATRPVYQAADPKRWSFRGAAAPGAIRTPSGRAVRAEFDRLKQLIGPLGEGAHLVIGADDRPTGPFSHTAGSRFAAALGLDPPSDPPPARPAPADLRAAFDPAARQRRIVRGIERHVQDLLRASDGVRDAFILDKLDLASIEAYETSAAEFRRILHEEVIGRIEESPLPPRPRVRRVYDEPGWIGYEVVLDVFPEVFAWGILCVPKDIGPGERRPVVVCQHGLEGLPGHTVEREGEGDGYRYYKAFAARLAERGFVTFAPHNPYRGRTRFRLLQRRANPLGLSLFSVIIAQHRQVLGWLGTLEFVDADRIGFYGLSYGGKTAMRVPAVLGGYALSICSADFNDWVRKNAGTRSGYSYMFTGEWEMPEFNLGRTFNYAEMAYLIAPRPFMVERGHDDGVAPDEWVAYEYAKVRRLYDKLGIGGRTAIEFFDGPHTIHGVGTFEFLHERLGWPEPAGR